MSTTKTELRADGTFRRCWKRVRYGSASIFRRVIVRLTDKAVREYSIARKLVLAQIEEGKRPAEDMMRTGRTIYMFEFIDHMENCINASRRVFALFEKIVADPAVSEIPAVQATVSHTASKGLADLRNTIEHMEDRIERGVIEGLPLALALSDDDKAVVVGCGRDFV